MPETILHTASLDSDTRALLLASVPGELINRGDHYVLHHRQPLAREQLEHFRRQWRFDINSLPEGFAAARSALLVTDMDSTLIAIECVDEIADFLDIKDQVAAITESAMRGDIDFNTSLRQRVKLLQGLDSEVLEKVYQQRLTLNPGAEQLITGLQQRGIKCALVSGGFRFFTDRLQQRLKLDFTLSNTLELENGRLTGRVLGDIVNGEVKAGFLQKLAGELGIDLAQTIAMGDGANDLPMMKLAGLGVAYRAKPKVQQQADVILNYAGLDAVLHFLPLDER